MVPVVVTKVCYGCLQLSTGEIECHLLKDASHLVLMVLDETVISLVEWSKVEILDVRCNVQDKLALKLAPLLANVKRLHAQNLALPLAIVAANKVKSLSFLSLPCHPPEGIHIEEFEYKGPPDSKIWGAMKSANVKRFRSTQRCPGKPCIPLERFEGEYVPGQCITAKHLVIRNVNPCDMKLAHHIKSCNEVQSMDFTFDAGGADNWCELVEQFALETTKVHLFPVE